MSNGSYRIRTDVLDDSDKYIRMKLDHDFDQLDVLSLSINQEQAYQNFCSDYGAVVGRVVANRSFGIPNVRVAIFIPISEEDKNDEKIRDLYPFETPRDKDKNGVRYNLLPKNRQFDCHTPVGTVPSKREILDNETMIEVYNKYYKYSTVTNSAGDFMIFGVPVGYHTLHMDADLSDIGFLSRKPYHFIEEGRDPNEFDSPTKFKETSNLDNAIQIETRDKGINVRPFWGDTDNCEVGITRVDFSLSHEFKSYAMFMGSLYTDNDKNSVNKNCRPRSKMGEVCEASTGEGLVEMIRKNNDGLVEQFNVNGGTVVDENGAWSYLIPMNLDNVVTDEFGNTVPSEDPNVGISTRSSVRFKIGMLNADAGRVRRTAKYLVPHNPDTYDDSDYSFGQETDDQHFKDLYWNKIYTVSNYIARYQGNRGVSIINNRNFVGMKNVDKCPSSNNPFPYNRINPKFNPLFNFLCIFVTLFAYLIWLINTAFVPIINGIINIIKSIVDVINGIADTINDTICDISINDPTGSGNLFELNCSVDTIDQSSIDYVPCINRDCGGTTYLPGCDKGSDGYSAASMGSGQGNTSEDDFIRCLELQLAESLDLYEMDFYNDWVNGALYHFLFKYKLKNNGSRPKLCSYNCDNFSDEFTQYDEYDDNDSNGNYNNCKNNNLIAETCYENSASDTEVFRFEDGIIMFTKDGELFYPPILHSSRQKLFPTDIMHLGSMLDCDPQGVPNVLNDLSPTSYKLPPLFNQYIGNDLDVTGLQPLFFDLSCTKGLTTETEQCTNHKRQCELGVDLDESDIIDGTQPDECINLPDMDDDRLDRDVITFYALSNDFETFDGTIGGNNIDSTIANGNCSGGYYSDFSDNGQHYIDFRGLNDSRPINTFERSYYFYFGLKPGKTAFDKTISKFYYDCDPPEENNLIIQGDVTNVSTLGADDGEIDVTVIGGTADYTYDWSGPGGYTNQLVSDDQGGDIANLEPGFYTVNVVDDEGVKGTATFQVKGPPPLSCSYNLLEAPTHEGTSDGEIRIDFSNGQPDYEVTVESTGGTVFCDATVSSNSYTCTGIEEGTYNFIVRDNSSPEQTCSGTTDFIDAPPELGVTALTKDVTCFDGLDDGRIDILTEGSYPMSTTAETSGSYYKENGFTYKDLDGGATSTNPDCITYDLTVEDATGQVVQKSVDICEPAKMELDEFSLEHVFCHGKNDGRITFSITGGREDYYAYLDNNGNSQTISEGQTTTFNGLSAGADTLKADDISGCSISDKNFTIQQPEPLDIEQITVESDHNIIIEAQGGNPPENYALSVYQFRVSACECSGTTFFGNCNPITDNNSTDDYILGTNGSNSEILDFEAVNGSNTQSGSDGLEYTEYCDPNTNTSAYSEVLKVEVTDTRVSGEYDTGNLNCDGESECVKTIYIAVTNSLNSSGDEVIATGYEDASDWYSGFTTC